MHDENTPNNTHEGINPAPVAEALPTAHEISSAEETTVEITVEIPVDVQMELPEGLPPAEKSENFSFSEELVLSENGLPEGIALPEGHEHGESNNAHSPEDAPVELDPNVVRVNTANVSSPAVTGIEILIEMATKGEIDPKNIDIIDVTDRFLKAISAVPKENLRQSGKIIFQASILLRMKAEALLAQKVEEEEMGFGDDFVDFDIDGSPIIYDSNHQPIARQITLADLERALVRQTKVRQMRHRRVTLEQLIEALREAERLEQNRGEKKIKPRIAIEGYNEMRDMDDILELAHDEDIEDVISRIDGLLVELFSNNDLLPLLRIVESLGGRGDWVDAFLAVLFLSNAGKISLQQEQMYGPLFVGRSEMDAQLTQVNQ